MKEIFLDEVHYLSVESLSKQFKYSIDYIEQICITKKVDAKLVNGIWFVNPASFEIFHKKNFLSTDKDNHIFVNSPLPRDITKNIRDTQKQNFFKRVDWKPLRYEKDTNELIPNIEKKKKDGHISINLADSSNLTIKSKTKSNVVLIPDDLPQVVLKGKIEVVSLKDSFDSEKDNISFNSDDFDPKKELRKNIAKFRAKPVKTTNIIDKDVWPVINISPDFKNKGINSDILSIAEPESETIDTKRSWTIFGSILLFIDLFLVAVLVTLFFPVE